MTAPRVSICVPVYRRPDLVTEAIRSALTQTMDDLEVVVVDNASPDDTYERCRAVAAEDDRVRVFRNDTNLGPVGNWARALAEARGQYAKLLFSDDLLEPRYLEACLPWLVEHDDIGCVWPVVRIGPNPGQGELCYDWPGGTGPLAARAFVRALLFSQPLVSPGAALFRLAELRRYLLAAPPGQVDWGATGAGPDLLCYLLAAADHARVAHVAEPLAFFRHHPGAITLERRVEVDAGYRQARIWFAARHAPRWWYARVAARAWLRARAGEVGAGGPGTFLAAYGGTPPGWRFWPAVLREACAYPFRRRAA